MSSGYIVFCYANCNFLVPLEQFHIILNPDEVANKIGSVESSVEDLYFGNKQINVLHLSDYLNSEPRKILSSSRLLVGEFDGRFLGFWVDSIMEIINVDNDKYQAFDTIDKNSFINKIQIEGEGYSVINLNNIIKERIT